MTSNDMLLIPLLLMLLMLLHSSDTHKILMLPFSGGSHPLYAKVIGHDLVARGHEVHMVLNPTYPDLHAYQSDTSIVVHVPRKAVKEMYEQGEEDEEGVLRMYAQVVNPVQVFQKNAEQYQPFCTNVMSDEDMYQKLKSLQLDIAMVSGFFGSRCLYALVYKLSLPHVTLSTMWDPWLIRTPALPSYVPTAAGTPYTDHMTYGQRLDNLISTIYWNCCVRLETTDDKWVTMYVNNRPHKALHSVAGDTLIDFVNTDVLLDYPRPTMPNTIDVGGILLQRPSPLNGKIGDYVESAKGQGLVLVTFGTFVRTLPQEWGPTLLEAFRMLPYKVLFKSPENLSVSLSPPNTLMTPRLPQADILAHPHTTLFVSHCAHNGLYEAMYHGVPVLCVPLFGDQKYNAVAAQYRGVARVINIATVTAAQLAHAIESAASNATLRDNMQTISQIYSSRPTTARERCVYWIEHVMQYSGLYLRSHAIDMVWYQYAMLDTLVVLIAAVNLTAIVMFMMVYFAMKYLCVNKRKHRMAALCVFVCIMLYKGTVSLIKTTKTLLGKVINTFFFR